jgi:hypothetical protein
VIVFAFAMCAVVLQGCSTITWVSIDSDPPGASVIVNDRKIGNTPVLVALGNESWQDYYVDFRKDGYLPLRRKLEKEVKTINVIGGLFFYFPFMWVYGPRSDYFFPLQSARDSSGQSGSIGFPIPK